MHLNQTIKERPKVGTIKIPPVEVPSIPRLNEFGRSVSISQDESGSRSGASELLEIRFEDLEKFEEKDESLGEGTFGVVKRIKHKHRPDISFARISAQKLLEDNPKYRECMDVEVPIAIANQSPYLVKYYGAFFIEGFVYILNEEMALSLNDYYRKAFEPSVNEPITERFLSKVAHAVLSAIAAMKERKIMHRDIKPSNILINLDGQIKVCDFGISGRIRDSLNDTYTGCQCYMAPEKIKSEAYTVNSDIWSLCIGLIEMSTGHHPLEKVSMFDLTQATAKLNSSCLNESASEEFRSFVDKCLVNDSSKRINLDDALNHPFIMKHLADQLDLNAINRIVTLVKKDRVKSTPSSTSASTSSSSSASAEAVAKKENAT